MPNYLTRVCFSFFEFEAELQWFRKSLINLELYRTQRDPAYWSNDLLQRARTHTLMHRHTFLNFTQRKSNKNVTTQQTLIPQIIEIATVPKKNVPFP